MPRRTFHRVVGIGQICRAKYNIERKWLERHTSLRATTDCLTRTVFDWQATPYLALLEYLRRDFRGMFEIGDLGMRDGRVVNERFGTLHVHDFPNAPNLSDHYAAAKSRHDHLCNRTREIMTAPQDTLFVRYGALPAEDEHELHRAIATLRGDRPFALALIDDDDLPPTDPLEPWQGNHAYWDRALAQFDVRSDAPVPRILSKMLRDQGRRIVRHVRLLRF